MLAPHIEGTVAIRSSAAAFGEAFKQRVAAGLLTGRPHPRSNYRVVEARPDRLLISAADWWTAINVGLNDVELRLAQPGTVQYRVAYWRWAAYGLGLSAALGLIGLVLILTTDVRDYLARHPYTMVPGISVDQHVRILWAMVVFWGVVWPWVLIAMHKGPLHRLVARLIGEVDATSDGRSHDT